MPFWAASAMSISAKRTIDLFIQRIFLIYFGFLAAKSIFSNSDFAIFEGQTAKRAGNIMIEKTQPIFLDSLRQNSFLEFERLGRVKVVAHDPGGRYVMFCRYQIGET